MRSRDVDTMRMRDVATVVLAGGKGARLDPLTRDRAKPAVPFGGSYRIIDFALSNCVNSGMRRVLLLTQYKAKSLDRHLNLGWHRFFCRDLGECLDVLPPQQRVDEILDKINQRGYHFLTEEEKEILKKAAEKDEL